MKSRDRLEVTKRAVDQLRRTRDDLRMVGASAAAAYVARAIKSAEGAVRHAERLCNEEKSRQELMPHADG